MVISKCIICKQLIERDFLKDVDAQNLQYPAQTFVNPMNLIETGHHEVNADSDPDLGAHGVLCCAEEGFDAQVLLDPFEEQFDLPPAFVNGCDGYRGQFEVVRKKDQPLTALCIDIADTPERFGIIALPLPCAQPNGLVASKPGGFINSSGLLDAELGVAFCADDKGCLCLLNPIETCEVEIAPVDHVDTTRLEDNLVEEMNVMDGSIGNAYKYRDRAGQVDLGMQFDRSLGSPEVCPWKHREAQVDGGGIDSIDHLLKIEPVGVIGIKPTSFADENLTECFINTPVSKLVRISQIGPSDVPTYAHGIALWAVSKTSFDIPQALAESDLCESHCKELVAGRHPFAGPGHRVYVDAAVKLLAVQQIDNLGEDKTSDVHPLLRMNPMASRQCVQMRDTTFSPLAA